jgi:hypothetical protein
MVSAIAHPKVVERTVKLALKADRYRDRELFFRLTGSLPDASINIFNNPTVQAATGKLADGEAPGWLETFDEEIIEMSRQLDMPESQAFLVKDGGRRVRNQILSRKQKYQFTPATLARWPRPDKTTAGFARR